MLLIRAGLVWFAISLAVVGAAFIFRRLFPRESPWLAFFVPEIVFVLACNFAEHWIALVFLPVVGFFASLAGLWTILHSPHLWRVMRLPSLVFLGAFAFTLLLRLLRPNVAEVPDGIDDMGLISAFCMGQTLPVDSTLIPPVKLVQYYYFGHYAASIAIRLFDLDIGTGFNVCAALCSAYINFFIAGTAWHLSRGKLWITLLMVGLTACAANGATAYLFLTVHDLEPGNISNLYLRRDDPTVQILLWKYIPSISLWTSHELVVPGFLAWLGNFHSLVVGQVLSSFAVLSLAEAVRLRASNWSWFGLALTPLLLLPSCSWCVPLTGLLLLGGIFTAWRMKIAPADWRLVVFLVLAGTLCLQPSLLSFLLWNVHGLDLNSGLGYTRLAEFLLQWWPVFLPWLSLFFIWKRLHPVTRIVLFVAAFMFFAAEIFNIPMRLDTTGKLWGSIYCIAWMSFVPVVAQQRAWFYRLLLVLLVLLSGISLCYWVQYEYQHINKDDVGRLDGRGVFRWDPRKAKLIAALEQMDHQTIVPGKSCWGYSENAMLAHFTLNRSFVSWSLTADSDFYSNGKDEAYRRETFINKIYDGKVDDPLTYLRQHNIAAFVIYPDDDIPDVIIDKLKLQLTPAYSYEDYRGDNPPNAGIFVYRPEADASPHLPAPLR